MLPPGNIAVALIRMFSMASDMQSSADAASYEEVPMPGGEGAFRVLTEAIPQIVWVTRPDGYHEYFNRHWFEYTGLTLSESRGQGWNAPIHPDDRQRSVTRWEQSFRTGEVYEIEHRLRNREGGSYRWFLCRAIPHREPSGEIVRWFGTCTDIHDQKLAESALREAKEQSELNGKSKDEFLSVISHELRTPLSAILGWAQLLEMGVLDACEAKEAVLTIKQQAKVQSQLIEDLLEVSRIINGKFHMRQEAVPVTAVLDRVIETIAPSAADKKVNLERKFWDASLQVKGDPQRIQQLGWNLLSNAVKFTPSGGKITVEIKESGGDVVLSICDTGRGIEAGQLAKIFEHFNQADSTHTRTEGGLGLGLSIVRHIVRMHCGSIDAISRGASHGSEFLVRLPRLVARSDAAAAPAAAALSPDALAGINILVIDDEESARTIAAAALQKFGAMVTSLTSAVTAIELLSGPSRFDILISDIGMPDVSGLDLIRAVRAASRPLCDLPAIALTAFASVDDQSLALGAGFTAHVAKPLDTIELANQVLRFVRR